MTREEQIKQAVIDYIGYPKEADEDMTVICKRIAFADGAKWADNNPRMFKGQTEQMEEREIAFMEFWLENHKGESPTFADAIAWADRTAIKHK